MQQMTGSEDLNVILSIIGPEMGPNTVNVSRRTRLGVFQKLALRGAGGGGSIFFNRSLFDWTISLKKIDWLIFHKKLPPPTGKNGQNLSGFWSAHSRQEEILEVAYLIVFKFVIVVTSIDFLELLKSQKPLCMISF